MPIPICGVVLCLALTSTSYGQDGWIGQKFMPREEAKLLDGDQEVSWERVGLPFVVREVKGEWLDVGRWKILKADVVPVEDAAAYYTDYIRREQSAEWA